MAEVDKFIPDLRSLVNPRAEQQLHDAFTKVYEFFERKLALLKEENNKLMAKQAASFQETSNLVQGIFATPLIGSEGNPNPLQSIGVGDGTVKLIVAGGGLSGGSISESGIIALLIGSANVVQKSNGTQLVDSQIKDGTDIFLDTLNLIKLGHHVIATIDDTNGLVILNMGSLPVADPGVSGALWNNAGVINVSP